MVLFKSLANTEIEELSSSSTDKTPAFPPTAIQLYSSKYIHFISHSIQNYQTNDTKSDDATMTLNDTNNNNSNNKKKDPKLKLSVKDLKSLPKEYELLSYQPIYVPDESNTMSSTKTTSITGNNNATATANSTSPNLGVWDCRCSSLSSSSSLSSLTSSTPFLLQSSLSYCNNITTSTKPTFLITIDLESLEEIQPFLTDMMKSIFQSMKSIQKSSNNKGQEGDDADGNKNGNGGKDGGAGEEKIPFTENNIQDDDFISLPKFGMAPSLQEGEKTKKSNQNPLLDQMNIVICAILPYYQDDDTVKYKQKQELNLVLYHLLKYANDLNCTLCFLNQNDCNDSGDKGSTDDDDGDSDGNGDGDGSDNVDEDGDGLKDKKKLERNGVVPNGLTVKEFAYLIRGICLGDETIVSSVYGRKSIVDSDDDADVAAANNDKKEEEKGKKEDTTIEDTNANGNTNEYKEQQEQSSIYLPNSYDVDLIDSVYLKSASCAGFWDANTDSLWVALPPPSSSSGSTSFMDGATSLGITKLDKISEDEKVDGKGGDEEWLSKLAESISAYTGGMGGGEDGRSTSRSISDDSSIKSNKTKGTKGTRVGFKDGSTVISSKTTKTTSTRKRVARPSKKSSSDEKEEVEDFFKALL